MSHVSESAMPQAGLDVPTVSVVIPTRNRRELLRRTLATVLWQTLPPVEIIVVDEASEDGTVEMLSSIDDPRLRVLRHGRPKGVSIARNAGLEAATGDWVAFLDDDDLWAPDKLAVQCDALLRSPGASWCCIDSVVVNSLLQPLGVERSPSPDCFPRLLLSRNCVPGGGSGVLARRETVRSIGGFDPRLSTLADWDLWVGLALFGPPAVAADIGVAYLRHEGSMTGRLKRFRRELRYVEDKHHTARSKASVGIDLAAWHKWAAYVQSRSGMRFPPAHHLLQAAGASRSARPLVLAAMTLANPRKTATLREGGFSDSQAWFAPTASWLGSLASQSPAPTFRVAPGPTRESAGV